MNADYTLEEVGQQLSVTRERTRQIRAPPNKGGVSDKKILVRLLMQAWNVLWSKNSASDGSIVVRRDVDVCVAFAH